MILPVWHHVDRDEVVAFSPPLADLRAAVSAEGLSVVVERLLKKLKPEGSPLVVARDILIEKGLSLSPPVITDEYWLDIVEIKEAELLFPDLNAGWHWNLPLPLSVRIAERGTRNKYRVDCAPARLGR